MAKCEPATREKIEARRLIGSDFIVVTAVGKNPSTGYTMKIEPTMIQIFPPEFVLLRCRGPEIVLPVETPYEFSKLIRYPADVDTITIHHAEGRDEVRIEPAGAELAEVARTVAPSPESESTASSHEATGISEVMKFDEAFANARNALPPPEGRPGAATRIVVLETGAFLSGSIGLSYLYVRVRSTTG